MESILLNCSSCALSKRSALPRVRRLPDSTFVVLAMADPPNTSASTFCTPAADRRLFISSSTEAAAASKALFDTLCRGRGEPNRNGSLRGTPELSFGTIGGLGAGENISCTLLEGLGYAFGLEVEPAAACDGTDFVSPLFCLTSSSSSIGRVGYNLSDGARLGERGHTGTRLCPGLPITRSNGGSTGLRSGVPGSRNGIGTAADADTRRIVVFAGLARFGLAFVRRCVPEGSSMCSCIVVSGVENLKWSVCGMSDGNDSGMDE